MIDKHAFEARGKIISTAAIIERQLDLLIAKYFTSDKDKQEDLVSLLFSTEKMNFKSKYLLFIDLLKKKIGSHDLFVKKFPGLQKRFDVASSVRNKFAHEVGANDSYFNKEKRLFEIVLIPLKASSKPEAFDAKDIKEIIYETLNFSDVFEEAERLFLRDGQVT